jgi:hypothetical protein
VQSPSSSPQSSGLSPVPAATCTRPADIPIPTPNDAIHNFIITPGVGFTGAIQPTLASYLSSQAYVVSQVRIWSGLDPAKVNWLSDLELMHHYSTVTYKSFPSSARAEKVFGDDIPRLAVAYPFVMHQVLALSAQHLRVLRPDNAEAYGVRAAHHQAQAIQGLREALPPSTEEINLQDAYALFVSASFLMCSSFAALRAQQTEPGSPPPSSPSASSSSSSFSSPSSSSPSPSSSSSSSAPSPLDNLLEIFSLIRGVGLILRMSRFRLRDGPMLNAFQYERHEDVGTGEVRQVLLPQIAGRLAELRAKLRRMGGLDGAILGAVDAGIVLLLGCVTPPWPEPRVIMAIEMRTVFLWPLIVGDVFMGLLRNRHPVTMPVLAYYCVLLKATEAGCWFVKGWSLSVSEYIMESVRGTQWEELCRWQLETIRERDVVAAAILQDLD